MSERPLKIKRHCWRILVAPHRHLIDLSFAVVVYIVHCGCCASPIYKRATHQSHDNYYTKSGLQQDECNGVRQSAKTISNREQQNTAHAPHTALDVAACMIFALVVFGTFMVETSMSWSCVRLALHSYKTFPPFFGQEKKWEKGLSRQTTQAHVARSSKAIP